MFSYLVFVGAGANFLAGLFYLRDTLRGRIQPNRVTWLMWSVAPLIGTAAALSDGVGFAVLPVFVAGFIPLLVFFGSFVNPKAYWKLETFDYFCGFCSVLAVILWGITQEPAIAIAFAIASDGLAGIPTLVKSWHYPKTESGLPYATGIFSALTGFTAVQTWVFSEYAFLIYILTMNSLLVLTIYRRRFVR